MSTPYVKEDAIMTTVNASKVDVAYGEIRARIIEGIYTAGYRLVLNQLATSIGVSPFPVREAIRRLESEGLVKFNKNVGAEVIGISPGLFQDAMEITALLEAYATARAVPHLRPGDIAQASDLNDEMRALSHEAFDPVRFTKLNQEFHSLLYASCPNTEALTLLRREQGRMATIRHSSFIFIPHRAQESVDEHDRLLHLLSTEKPDTASIEYVAREHKLNTLRSFLESHQE